jgi:hypothetical protein
LESDNYCNLTAGAVKLLVDIGSQYTGKNNGDLTAALTVLKGKGWKSPSTLDEKLSELLHYGFIIKTRQGGRNQCSLYALTWQSIDECGTRLDVKETKVASGEWKEKKPKYVSKRKRPKKQTATQIVATENSLSTTQIEVTNYANRSNETEPIPPLLRESKQSAPFSVYPYYANRRPLYNYTNTNPKNGVPWVGHRLHVFRQPKRAKRRRNAQGRFDRGKIQLSGHAGKKSLIQNQDQHSAGRGREAA